LKIKYLTLALIFLIVTTVFAQDTVIFKELPLTGKLVTAEDPITIGDNFQQLTNMRYRRSNPVSISGMSEINTTAVTSVEEMTNGYHFIKHQPAESHVLIQGRDDSDANPIIFQNTTAIPSQGDMSGGATPTALYTEDTSAGMARFSSAPGGNVVICDSVDCLIWGGDEAQIGAFITSTATIGTTVTNPRDYTDEVKNTLTASTERAVIGGGCDSDIIALYHFDSTDADNNTPYTDDSDCDAGATHDLTASGNVASDEDQAKFGSTASLHDGVTDYLTAADHADYAFGLTAFTIDFWVRFSDVLGHHSLYSHVDTGANGQLINFYQDHARGKLIFVVTNTTNRIVFKEWSWSPSANTWYHVALIRGWGGSANNLVATIDGTSLGTYDITGVTLPIVSSTSVLIGACDPSECFIDLGNTGHELVAVNGTDINNTTAKWTGTEGSLYYDGTTDYIGIDNHADWDIAGSTSDSQTIDLWVKHTDHVGDERYVTHYEDANDYWIFDHLHGTGVRFILEDDPLGVIINMSGGEITDTNWHHVAVVKVAGDYALYVDGTRVATASYSATTVDFTAALQIGDTGAAAASFEGYMQDVRVSNSDVFSAGSPPGASITVPTTHPTADANTSLLIHGSPQSFAGWLDEYRIATVAKWQSTFTPPSRPYSTEALDWLVGSTMPLDGVKIYIPTGGENVTASTLTGTFWNGHSWTSLTNLTDNTDTGASLAQSGTVTWDSTVDLARPKFIDSLYLYWYNFNLDAGSAEIYHVTVSTPMQKMNDIWDGEYISLLSAAWYNTAYTNSELPIYEVDYVASDLTTYWDLNGQGAATYGVFGFSDRMTALYVEFAANSTNTAAATSSVAYWDGSAWADVGTITDGTLDSGSTKTFNTSGVISWNAPDEGQEFTTSISDSVPLYFYKVTHSAQFSATDIFVDYIAGIPVKKTLLSYKFPIHSKDRLFLCSEQSQDKNKCIASAQDTSNVWNGSDYVEFWFGDEKELMSGTSLYSRLGSSLYEVTLFFKRDKIYGLIGSDSEDFTQYLINDSVGLTAPLTLKTTTVQLKNISKPIAIWQGADGIYLFDNSSVILISEDIANFFDDNESASRRLHASYIDDSVAFIDHDNHEYHWLFADGNSTGLLNREFVFDYILLKWYEIDRGVGDTGADKDDLQAGFSVRDTTGNYYTYGLTDEGDMLRLENGTTFDGDNMTFTLWTGAWTPVEGSIMWNTKPIRHKLLMKSKANTTNTVAITHYLDRKTTGTSLTVADLLQEGNVIYTPGIFHSFKYVMTTNNETVGFEPLAIGTKFAIEDEDRY
jgi:hypothetical protein